MPKNEFKSKSKSRKNARGGQPKCNDKAILRFKKSTPNSTTISAKFKDADNEEVKEYLPIFQQGDDKACLIEVFKRLLSV